MEASRDCTRLAKISVTEDGGPERGNRLPEPAEERKKGSSRRELPVSLQERTGDARGTPARSTWPYGHRLAKVDDPVRAHAHAPASPGPRPQIPLICGQCATTDRFNSSLFPFFSSAIGPTNQPRQPLFSPMGHPRKRVLQPRSCFRLGADRVEVQVMVDVASEGPSRSCLRPSRSRSWSTFLQRTLRSSSLRLRPSRFTFRSASPPTNS